MLKILDEEPTIRLTVGAISYVKADPTKALAITALH